MGAPVRRTSKTSRPIVKPTSETSSHSQTETDICTICLSRITERAVATPCNHLDFDFHCLAQWLQSSASCPLCKAEVREVQYDFRDVEDYKRYDVLKALRQAAHTSTPSRDGRARSSAPAFNVEECAIREHPSLTTRRQVYADQSYSSHVGNNALSGYTAFTPPDFANSQGLQSKARLFLRRELQVFSDSICDLPTATATRTRGRLQQRAGATVTISYMIEYIITILRLHELKAFDGQAEELVAEFIGTADARLLLHELDAWLRSPYLRLEEWDDAVQYG